MNAVPAVDGVLGSSPLAALAVMFLAGLATSLTPCVYPMIPITAGILGGAGASGVSRRGRAFMIGCYVVGLSAVYAGLGLLAGMTGSLFGTVSADHRALMLSGNVLLLAALVMLDVIPLRLPERLARWSGSRAGGSPGAAFILGATSGLVAAPCGAPAFAAALTWVAGAGSAVWGFAYLFVFSLGMTVLLIVVGLVAGSLAVLPRSGPWLLRVKQGGGIVLLAMAEYYLIRAGMAWP